MVRVSRQLWLVTQNVASVLRARPANYIIWMRRRVDFQKASCSQRQAQLLLGVCVCVMMIKNSSWFGLACRSEASRPRRCHGADTHNDGWGSTGFLKQLNDRHGFLHQIHQKLQHQLPRLSSS
jgi:hypothetical protein